MTDLKPTDAAIQPFQTAKIRRAMLDAIAKAEAAGVPDESLDRMRLACEFFTNQRFAAGMAEMVWKARI